MAAARAVFAGSHGDNALTPRRVLPLVAAVVAAAGLTWWLDAVLLHRVANGTDHGTRLAAILTYVGVDGSYTLARALGLTALVFAYVTVVLGLIPVFRAAGPSGILGALHRQAGAVTIALVGAHATVPYTSAVPPYGGWRTALVPFGQPVSWGIKAAAWESLGILALYLLVLTAPTYWLVRRRRRAWAAAHRLTIGLYALSVAHAFLLGTDFIVSGPPRVVLLAAQVPLLALLALRLAPARPSPRAALRWLGTVLVGVASAGMAALTVLSVTGEYAPGMRL